MAIAMAMMIATTKPVTNAPNNTGCRAGCGACCIAPSISSAIPGMPAGKPAGVRCVQLNDNNLCRLFGDSRRPQVCHDFDFDQELCGSKRSEALHNITLLEEGSAP